MTPEYKIEELLAGMTDENLHEEVPMGPMPRDNKIAMPRDLIDRQADAANAATASFLNIKGSQLTVNREKMKARYRALVRFIEKQNDRAIE